MEPTSVHFQMAQAVEKHLESAGIAYIFTGGHAFALSEAKIDGGGAGAVIDGTTDIGHHVIIDITQIVAVKFDIGPPGATM